MRLYCVEFDTEDHGTVRAWFSTKKEANKYYNTTGKENCEGWENSLSKFLRLISPIQSGEYKTC